MIWISVGMGFVCGAIAFLFASLVVGDRKNNKRQFSVVATIAMFVLIAISRETITPLLQDAYSAYELDISLATNPAFTAMKQYDSSTYTRIRNEVLAAVRGGKSEAQAAAVVRKQIISLVQQRLPNASDEAASSYMRLMVQEMIEVQKHGGDACYSFLFPQAGDSDNPSRFIPDAIQQADVSALGEIIRTSASDPQSTPTREEILPFLIPIMKDMTARYGQDFAQQLQAPAPDKAKVCEITIAMYSRVLELPADQRGKLVRYMLQR